MVSQSHVDSFSYAYPGYLFTLTSHSHTRTHIHTHTHTCVAWNTYLRFFMHSAGNAKTLPGPSPSAPQFAPQLGSCHWGCQVALCNCHALSLSFPLFLSLLPTLGEHTLPPLCLSAVVTLFVSIRWRI